MYDMKIDRMLYEQRSDTKKKRERHKNLRSKENKSSWILTAI